MPLGQGVLVNGMIGDFKQDRVYWEFSGSIPGITEKLPRAYDSPFTIPETNTLRRSKPVILKLEMELPILIRTDIRMPVHSSKFPEKGTGIGGVYGGVKTLLNPIGQGNLVLVKGKCPIPPGESEARVSNDSDDAPASHKPCTHP